MEVKKPQPEDWKSIDQFLKKSLRGQVDWALDDEYPLAFAENNRHNIRFIRENDEICSHAVFQPSLIRTHYHLFRVGLIGSVVTTPSKQGQGYSRQIIESCLAACKENGCDFSILWTELFNFYAKFGFEVAGTEITLQVDKSFEAPIKPGLKILETNKVAPANILKVYNQHMMKTLRNPADVQKYLNIPNSEVYTAWNSQTNVLEAYCVLGKGADFHNYVHEWGGNVSSLMSLMKHIYQKKQKPITIITPPQCTNLITQMEKFKARKFFGVLGMIKIINPSNFCKKIKKGARAQGYDSFIFEFRDGFYYFGYGEEIFKTDFDQDIVRLVFGPMKPGQIHSFSESTLEAFEQIFPIPFWVWGWDSI